MEQTCGYQRQAARALTIVLGILVPALAFAQSNVGRSLDVAVTGPSASLPETPSVTGTQTIAEIGECSVVTVEVTGRVTGTTNDGGGLDQVRIELWDDGELKDSEIITVPVGTTAEFQVTLTFQGRYGGAAPGVGVQIVDVPLGILLFGLDPFFPVDVPGSCPAVGAVPILAGHGAFLLAVLGLVGTGLLALTRRTAA